MALALNKEDGTGKPTANTYALAADADSYHEGHLYAVAWTAATADQKAAALVMATRVIDAEYQFNGYRAGFAQALQWPRAECREPDGGTAGFGARNVTQAALHGILPDGPDAIVVQTAEWFVPPNLVPKAVVEATCELARELLIVNRTEAPAGEGLSFHNVGGTQTGYNKSDKRPIIPALVQAMLAKYGALINRKSGTVQLVRA
ncbi:MAG: hypothetical protein QM813_01220 [Verrucomicrobiota bacterium]